MTMSEFAEKTGFTPTYEEFQKIEEEYCRFDGTKEAFCHAFVSGQGEKRICQERARRIDQLKSLLVENDRSFRQMTVQYEKKLELLKTLLQRQPKCRPCGTAMEQRRYERLLRSASARVMTKAEARQFIAEQCGFSPEKIRIVTEVASLEDTSRHPLKRVFTYTRRPVFSSADWNYVRFDCANVMYEYVNGAVLFYRLSD